MKTKSLILGSVLIASGLAVYLFLKNKKSKAQSVANNAQVENNTPVANNATVVKPLSQQVKPQLQEEKIVLDIKSLLEAKELSKIITSEVIKKTKFKKASSRANVDTYIASLKEQMAKLGYKPLPNGGVEKI
jgi:hypothetical protein